MFKFKLIIPATIFLTLLIITSAIKNQTRDIEKKLLKLNKKITLKEKDINESQLDFYFLTSPSQIEKKLKMLGKDKDSPIEKSKRFISYSSFVKMKKKIPNLNVKYEKKTKKN